MNVAALYHLQTESQWLAQVRRIAERHGWRVYHTRDARGSDKGFPDLVLVRRPRVIFVELKTERGRLTPDQADWLRDLGDCPGVEVALWRPSHEPLIERTLR